MPFYEYECEDCGNVQETFSPIIPRTVPETSVLYCTKCRGATTFRKVISANSFSLKGDGWAKDGYTKR